MTLLSIESGKQIDALLLDFLIKFLMKCYISSYYIVELLELDQSFIQGWSQSVVIDGVNNKPSSALSGVPQGIVLAPLLFFIFINDIVQDLQCTVKPYAEEILIRIY